MIAILNAFALHYSPIALIWGGIALVLVAALAVLHTTMWRLRKKLESTPDRPSTS